MQQEDVVSILKSNNLGILKTLKKLDTGLDFDATAITNKLDTIETKINQIPITDLSTVNNKLDQLLLNSQPSTSLTFTELTLNATYQVNSSHGWMVAPVNIEALYDNDNTTASNLFKIGGLAWCYGEIILIPSISIPQRTKIELKVGLRNSNNQRSLFELAVFDVAKNSYINVWSYSDNLSSTNELIANIDVPYFYYWDKLRFRLWDVGQFHAEARFYGLKVWAVT